MAPDRWLENEFPMDEIIHKPLRDIVDPEEMTELFFALQEKNADRLTIIEKLEHVARAGEEPHKSTAIDVLSAINPKKQRDAFRTSLQIPWGDWSRIYRVRGILRAIERIEGVLLYSDTDPNVIYNLGFLYYIAYSFIRDEHGNKDLKYRTRALDLAAQARRLYENDPEGKLGHFLTLIGSLLVPEWRKNLPQYCASLACNIVSLIHLLDNDLGGALVSINEAFETHPTPPEVYFSMGVYLRKKGAFNPAIRMLNESIKKKGEHLAEAHYQLGRAYYTKVEKLLQQAKEAGADPSGERKSKRLRRLADDRIKKAVISFEASISEDANFSLPYYWIGITCLLSAECNCDKAMKCLDSAMRLDHYRISRYIRERQFTCRSRNTACNRARIKDFIEGISDPDMTSGATPEPAPDERRARHCN